MKNLLFSICVALSSVSLLADTREWNKTDEAEGWWSTAWSQDANWVGSVQPAEGDSVELSAAPDAGIDRISTIIQSDTSYKIDTLSGTASYDILFGLNINLYVRDPSQFFGMFRTGENSWHQQGYNGSQPASLWLEATAAHSPVVNYIDARYGFDLRVADAGTSAEVLSVVNTKPGFFSKKGLGELVATFDQGNDQTTYVEQGTLTVRPSGGAVDLGGAMLISGNAYVSGAKLGVKAGETVKIGAAMANGGALVKVGDGKLVVGRVVPLDVDGGYETGKADVLVQGGSIGTLARQPLDTSAITTDPYLHLDASQAGAFTFDTGDSTLISSWKDLTSTAQRTATAGCAEGGRLPKLIANGLNDMPIVDLGTFRGDANAGDGTDGYFSFENTSVRAGFFVLRQKEANTRAFFIGDGSGDYSFHRGDNDKLVHAWYWGGGASPRVAIADWRVDGAPADVQRYRLAANEFHLVSFENGENNSPQNTIGRDRVCRYGGLEIAEVILYDRNLQPGERAAIEAYLLEKWGLASTPVRRPTATFGTITFGAETSFEFDAGKNASVDTISGRGIFVKTGSGAVSAGELAGATGVVVRAGSLAIGVPQVDDVIAQATFHVDPSLETSLEKNGSGLVTKISDVRGEVLRYATTSPASAAAGPSLYELPNGKSMLDFGTYCSALAQGDSCGMLWNEKIDNVHSAIIVVERKSGNDNFLLGDRIDYPLHSGANLVAGNSAEIVRDGNAVWMIDGETIAGNPADTAWPEGVHVIAFSCPKRMSSGVLWQGINAQYFAQDRDQPCRIGGMRYGEVMVFQQSLSEAALKAVSQALMAKWLSTEETSRNEFNCLSVGAGANCSMAGSVAIADNGSIDIGFARAGGSGVIEIAGVATLGRNVAVTVGPDPKGSVAVISVGGFAEGAADAIKTWTLNGESPKFTIVDNVLYANCKRVGLMVLVR